MVLTSGAVICLSVHERQEAVLESLALQVEPIAGECATSLASRLAERNGEPRLRRFCTHMSLPIKELRLGERGCLLRVSKLSGHDLAALTAGTPCQKEAGYFDLGTERIKFPAFLRTTMRVCPFCVQECGFHQKGLWQLGQIRICPIHLCLLQSLPRLKLADDQLDVVTCARNRTLVPATSRSNAPMVISRVSKSDWAWDVLRFNSYIAEIAPPSLSAGEAGCAFNTNGDLGFAALPFLP